ncbi:MAG: pyridoxamine 5'-phosphate oxidase family protein [Minwuiales bacterium]|nr:pyridoxamine 5'-phosphate oxidase family protein [Minwuiales bacterium]
MGILNEDMKRLVDEQKLGFVATVGADGTPNLSPKGTMVVLDDEHIAFGEIRSPNTVENLRHNPVLEINFVDPFARKGYRFKGRADFLERGSDAFNASFAPFAQWGDLASTINGIVRVRVERALPITSPAYDMGASEADLRAQWTDTFERIQPGGRFAGR